jgi:putative transcriptional regulator
MGAVPYFYPWLEIKRRTGSNNLVMAIIVNLDVMLAKRKMSLTELTEKVGITMANLSILKKGHAKAIRFSTLDKICEVLDCQPGDILEYLKKKNE